MTRRPLLILVALTGTLGLAGSACNSATTPPKITATAQAAATPTHARHDEPPLELEGPVPEADPREKRLALGLSLLLEREHLRQRAIDDDVSRLAFSHYIEALDPGKLLLLKSHVDALSRDAANMDDQLREGDLRLARTSNALRIERTQKIAKVVSELLASPFDLSQPDVLESDSDKRAFAESEEELKGRWRKILKNEVLGRIARMEDRAEEEAEAAKEAKGGGGKRAKGKAKKGVAEAHAEQDDDEAVASRREPPPPATFEGREKKAREDLAKTYDGRFNRMTKPEPLEAAEMFLNAIASVFDPHTRYLAPAEKENFDIQITGSLEGIGAVLSEDDHYIEVREVVPGGAAWREGNLEAGDLIMAVRQGDGEPVDVVDMRIGEVVRMIRGPKGSVVSLTVKKPDDRTLTIDITRDVVVVEDAYAKGAVLDLGEGYEEVGYVNLPSFYGNTRGARGRGPERDATSDVAALLGQFRARKVGGVVIDLRGNGGGLLSHATGIAGLLIDRGPVVQVQNSGGKLEVLGDNDPGVSFSGPVVVLVDRFSASASEILAGALKDYNRALIVGTGPTHGKGTVQTLVDLQRLAREPTAGPLGIVKLTIQQFYLVGGSSTQWRGVEPDVVLPDPAVHLKTGERFLDGAMPFSAVTPVTVEKWQQRGFAPSTLSRISRERTAEDPVFGKIRARGAYLLDRRDDTQIELDLPTWRKQREQDKRTLEELDTDLEDTEPRFSVEPVYYTKVDAENAKQAKARKGKTKANWEEGISHDPWLEEALRLLNDMHLAAVPEPIRTAAE